MGLSIYLDRTTSVTAFEYSTLHRWMSENEL